MDEDLYTTMIEFEIERDWPELEAIVDAEFDKVKGQLLGTESIGKIMAECMVQAYRIGITRGIMLTRITPPEE